MAMAAGPRPKARRLWTYDEMIAELSETNLPTESWNGEIITSPAPNPDHQEIVLNFAERLKKFVTQGKLGKVYVSPVDVVLTQHRTVQPDVLFVSTAQLNIITSRISGKIIFAAAEDPARWR